MSITFRQASCLLILGLSLISPALAQSQSVSTSPTSLEVKDLAVALVRIKSEAEQDQLLVQKNELKDAELLRTLKGLADPLVQNGEYNEALRISHLAVRIAEQMGDGVRLAHALCDLGGILARRNPPKEAFPHLQRSLALLEEAEDKKGQARAFIWVAVASDSETRFEVSDRVLPKESRLSQEIGDEKAIARIWNGMSTSYKSHKRNLFCDLCAFCVLPSQGLNLAEEFAREFGIGI